MVKKLLIFFTIFTFLLFPSIIFAETNTGTNSAEARLREQLQMKKAEIMDLRGQIKSAIQIKREEMKSVTQAKRDEFKIKLQTIKDERKKSLVERIDIKLSSVNAKHTDRFTEVLNNLQIILDKIGTDTDKATAQATINEAKVAVENQAAKTYTITISAETALRADVGAVISQLRLDLMATHKLVIDAKQAVQSLRKNSANTTNL